MTSKPQAIVFQLVTNDVKDQRTLDTAKEYIELVDTTKVKFPMSKVIISQASFERSSTTLSNRITTVNAALADNHQGSDIICVENSQIESFASDGIHLNKQGTSALARNIKAAILECLGLPAQPMRPQRRETRHRRTPPKDTGRTHRHHSHHKDFASSRTHNNQTYWNEEDCDRHDHALHSNSARMVSARRSLNGYNEHRSNSDNFRQRHYRQW
jgi:hypothetical protein